MCDLSQYMPFSPFLSGFVSFCQFAIWPGTSHRSSIPYSSNVLWSFANSVILTLPVRFLPFFPDCHITRDIYRAFYSISAIWSLISICVNPLVIFLAKFTTFYPPDRFSPFPQDSSFSQIDPLTRDISRSLVISISAFFNFCVRFWPFLPIRHLTRDISLSIHYIFVERFVIFRHFCHSHLPCQVFALFSRLSFYHGYLSGILFNFRYLVIFWSDLPFSPFWSGFGIFFQIGYFTKKSFGASFQSASTLWWFFLPNSQLFTLLTGSLRFRRIRRFSQIDHLTRDIWRSLN